MKLRTSTVLWPFYLLVLSLFTGNFLFQYAALTILLFLLLLKNPSLRANVFVQIAILFFAIAVLSYLYNLIKGNTDGYSILFWMFSYLPPFFLMWIVLSCKKQIEFEKIYWFYKRLVYVEAFLLIISAIQYRSLVVGDPATGTIGDANWVAFHIAVVLIYEIIKLVDPSKKGARSSRRNIKAVFEILFLAVVFVIPESTANLGFVLLIVGLIFFKEIFLVHLNFLKMAIFFVVAVSLLLFISNTLVFDRIRTTFTSLASGSTDENYNYFKLSMYKKLLSGELYQDANFILGSGPASFTSRSAVVRMPEERTNDFPIELPYFKSKIFEKHISPAYADWRRTKESYGNFASPQTTIISISVELGLAGLFIFSLFFLAVFRKLSLMNATAAGHLPKFGFYFTLFFIFCLLHLNFWEYPIISFTYIFLISVIMKQNGDVRRAEPKN